MNMIIAIDHGNSTIKTVHEQFTSGFSVYNEEPPMTDEVLKYGQDFYTLTRTRLPYRYDKTKNDDYYILTLFAIGKELLRQGISQPTDIQLSVGLPPRYFSHLRQSFSDYFMRDRQPIQFVYAHKPFSILIDRVYVFPQCWSAMMNRWDEIKKLPDCAAVDIGGYTVDIICFHYGKPDMEKVYSLSKGVNNLITDISEVLESESGSAPDDSMIVDVILGRESILPAQEKQLIIEKTKLFTNTLINEVVNEKHVNSSRSHVYFMGGGSMLLKEYLNIDNIRFITDILANAKGYENVAAQLYSSEISHNS
jgi:plasmid segregation protein ParM